MVGYLTESKEELKKNYLGKAGARAAPSTALAAGAGQPPIYNLAKKIADFTFQLLDLGF